MTAEPAIAAGFSSMSKFEVGGLRVTTGRIRVQQARQSLQKQNKRDMH